MTISRWPSWKREFAGGQDMISTDELFTQDDTGIWDILAEMGLDPEKYSLKEQRKIFEKLPEEVRNIAHCWGLNDTVFRDEAFVYLRDNRHLCAE